MLRRLLIFICLLVSFSFVKVSPVNLSNLHADTMHVSIQGEVAEPQVIEIPLYSTIEYALKQVELKETSDLSTLNLSTILQEGDVVNVPVKQEESTITKISINFADTSTLTSLPGIGESTAEKIVAYREENGLFQTLEELMNVKGIGQAKYENLLPYITL